MKLKLLCLIYRLFGIPYYKWVQLYGPSTVTIENPYNSKTLKVIGVTAGTYGLRCIDLCEGLTSDVSFTTQETKATQE